MLCFSLFLYSESVLCSVRNSVRQLDYSTSKSYFLFISTILLIVIPTLLPNFSIFQAQAFPDLSCRKWSHSSDFLEDIAITSQVTLLVSYYGNFCSLLEEIARYFGKIHRVNLGLNLGSCFLLIMWTSESYL